jgi:hypothetical protein
MEAKSNINVVNNFYFFEKSSKLLSSSMMAYIFIVNIVNIFYKIYQIGRKPVQADADRSCFGE